MTLPWITNDEAEDEIDATPAARVFAEENNIDLSDVEGTGSGGRIILSDVESLAEEEEIFPLEDFDRGLQPEIELAPESEVVPEPEAPAPTKFPLGTRIVDAAQGKKMLASTHSRFQRIAHLVAYLGQGEQPRFVLSMVMWQVVPGGILYVPQSLSTYEGLNVWERLEEDTGAPEGFVAFRAP